jgi:regulator of replication initiation timing
MRNMELSKKLGEISRKLRIIKHQISNIIEEEIPSNIEFEENGIQTYLIFKTFI